MIEPNGSEEVDLPPGYWESLEEYLATLPVLEELGGVDIDPVI